MKITRLYLRGYRTFEDEVELDLPGGLVGIYGPNGSGKSSLIESIRWTLFGRARTAINLIRTTGVNTDCTTEVEFEHEGHLYLVRRTISGQNHTVKAEAHADGMAVATTVTEVARYVQSVIGMDDAAFRASVFAEQKQVAAFTSTVPGKRKELVLRLLGVTPLDQARSNVSKDARARREQHERILSLLGDLDDLHARVDDTRAEADAAAAETALRAAATVERRTHAEEAAAELARLDGLSRAYADLVNEGKLVASQRDSAIERAQQCRTELDALEGAAQREAQLEPLANTLDGAEARLAAVSELAKAEAELARLPAVDPPPPADDDALVAAEEAAAAALGQLSEIRGQVQAAQAELSRAREAASRSGELSGEGTCPMCGQALGDAFERVQKHRDDEVAAAAARLADLAEREGQLVASADESRKRLETTRATVTAARQALVEHERTTAARRSAQARVDELAAALDPPAAVGEQELLVAAVAEARAAARELVQLRTRLERRPTLTADLEQAEKRSAELDEQRRVLLDKVKDLDFDKDRFAAAQQAAEAARRQLEEADRAERAAVQEQAKREANAAAAAEALANAEAQHAKVADLADETRHLDRLATLMTSFRDEVVGQMGGQLAAQAADLFAELTDNEYDSLVVDDKTYELQISDQANSFGLDRYSGSEVDLANLALRVAISEQVRFQSGGAVGLLVLDEVFGPLDSDRKERMLLALERLRGRFRQVLVVTHDQEIKEQMPNAIEIVKLGRRRSTARPVAVGE